MPQNITHLTLTFMETESKRFEGEERRQTVSMSSEEKSVTDAQNLIKLAKDRYGKEQVTVRDALDLATRDDDNIEALRKAIAIEVKKKPDFEQFVDGLGLSDEYKEKLKEMMSSENYKEAVATEEEDMNPGCKIPGDLYARVVAELMTWSEEKLRAICEEAERPRLLVITPNGFDERTAAMDKHKRYTSREGEPQKDIYCDRSLGSPYENPPIAKKGKVTISDDVPHPAQLTGVSTKLGERRGHLTKRYAQRGMRHIDKDEMATLLQLSIRKAQATGDNSGIVDNWEDGDGTITFVNPDSLTKSAFVACAFFGSRDRRAIFGYYDPGDENVYARGRASVQVLEFDL